MRNTKSASIVTIAIIFLPMLLLISLSEGWQVTAKVQNPHSVRQYTDHGPIGIISNSNFHAQAEIEGWDLGGTRNGSFTGPYLIEGLSITSKPDDGFLIHISNTDVHFQISNCLLNGTDYQLDLENVSNFQIDNCILENAERGLYLREGSNGIIINNSFLNLLEGIVISGSSYNTFSDNLISPNIKSSFGMGIAFHSQSNENLVSNNTISDSARSGLEIHDSNSNTITNNDFLNNNPCKESSQAFDSESTNNSFSQNYWDDWTTPDNDSDGIVDTPYQIDEAETFKGGNVDNFPRTSPNNPNRIPGLQLECPGSDVLLIPGIPPIQGSDILPIIAVIAILATIVTLTVYYRPKKVTLTTFYRQKARLFMTRGEEIEDRMIILNKISLALLSIASIMLIIANLMVMIPLNWLVLQPWPIDAFAFLILGIVMVFEFFQRRTQRESNFLYIGLLSGSWGLLTITWRPIFQSWAYSMPFNFLIDYRALPFLSLFFLASICLTIALWKFITMLYPKTRLAFIAKSYLFLHQTFSILLVVGFGFGIIASGDVVFTNSDVVSAFMMQPGSLFRVIGGLGKAYLVAIIGIFVYLLLVLNFLNQLIRPRVTLPREIEKITKEAE